jgi:hypothetical protein
LIEDAAIREGLLADQTAEEYRRKGYEVLREPQLDFLPGFSPDLVVRKGDETIVVEVKARSSLAANPKIKEFAQVIRSKPGWSFDLILVAEPEKLDSPEDAQPLSSVGIVEQIEKAERALESDLPEAAFLLAWSACEAAIREKNASHGVSTKGISTASYVLNQAVSQGVISRDEYNKLTGMMRYRNAIVHGFSLNNLSDKLVKDLVKSVRRMAKVPA